MEVKVLEIRDHATFIPVICIWPVPDNEEQRYLLRRDGYSGRADERCIIMVNAQCRGANYDPYNWGNRTLKVAHDFIRENWRRVRDGDVIDVEFILGEKLDRKVSERLTAPL